MPVVPVMIMVVVMPVVVVMIVVPVVVMVPVMVVMVVMPGEISFRRGVGCAGAELNPPRQNKAARMRTMCSFIGFGFLDVNPLPKVAGFCAGSRFQN